MALAEGRGRSPVRWVGAKVFKDGGRFSARSKECEMSGTTSTGKLQRRVAWLQTWLEQARAQRVWQLEIAQALGVSPEHVSNLKKGERALQPDQWVNLALYLWAQAVFPQPGVVLCGAQQWGWTLAAVAERVEAPVLTPVTLTACARRLGLKKEEKPPAVTAAAKAQFQHWLQQALQPQVSALAQGVRLPAGGGAPGWLWGSPQRRRPGLRARSRRCSPSGLRQCLPLRQRRSWTKPPLRG